MGKYPLEALLNVRYLREETAQKTVRVAEKKLQAARADEEKKAEELLRYQQWWPQEVDRRYEEFLGNETNLTGIEKFRASLSALADGEVPRAEAVNEARKLVRQGEAELAAAHKEVAAARKAAAKIETHREIWRQDEKKEAERQADLEMEEFHPPARESDEE